MNNTDDSLEQFAKRVRKWRDPEFQNDALASLIRSRADALRVFRVVCGLLDAAGNRDRLDEREAIHLLLKVAETPEECSLLAKTLEYLMDDIYDLNRPKAESMGEDLTAALAAKNLAAAETLCEALETSLKHLRLTATPTTEKQGGVGAPPQIGSLNRQEGHNVTRRHRM